MSNTESRSKEEIEKDKKTAIDEAVRMYNVEGQIRVFDIAEKIFNIGIVANNNLDVSGSILYNKENESFVIELNPREGRRRQRFTVGHELGHFILHNNKLRELGSLDRDSDIADIEMERKADKFAGKLLMPDASVFFFVKTRFDIKRNQLIDDKNIIERIADEFNVSVPAVIIRLRELKYYVPYIAL